MIQGSPTLVLSAVVAGLLLFQAPAWADASGKLEVGISGMLGVGDEGEVDSARLGKIDGDLDPSGGFGIHVLYEVLPFLDVGGRLAALWWRSEDQLGGVGVVKPIATRGTMLDISLLAKGRMRFLDDRLEAYLKMPFGLTISILEDNPAATKGRTGVGVNFGLLPGVSWTFLGHYGVFMELGYALHWVKHKREFTANFKDTQKYLANEFALNLGFAYRF